MPFGAHETMEVHEILTEKINLINHFTLYAEQCQDRQLRQIIDRHLQTAVQSYNQLVSYTHDYSSASQGQSTNRSFNMQNVQTNQIQYGLNHPAQVSPQMGQARLNDQQIMTAMLLCHKNSANNHMKAALEVADPNVRQMLMNGAITCANQAYELFIQMNQQGQYQVPTMHDHTAKTYLHAFQPTQSDMQMSSMSNMNNMNNINNMNANNMNSNSLNSGMSSAYNQQSSGSGSIQ